MPSTPPTYTITAAGVELVPALVTTRDSLDLARGKACPYSEFCFARDSLEIHRGKCVGNQLGGGGGKKGKEKGKGKGKMWAIVRRMLKCWTRVIEEVMR